MNRYEHHLPAPIIAVAAVLATVVTMALAVIMPAELAPIGGGALAGARPAAAAPVEVAIVPARIDVVGVRNAKSAASEMLDSRIASRRRAS